MAAPWPGAGNVAAAAVGDGDAVVGQRVQAVVVEPVAPGIEVAVEETQPEILVVATQRDARKTRRRGRDQRLDDAPGVGAPAHVVAQADQLPVPGRPPTASRSCL